MNSVSIPQGPINTMRARRDEIASQVSIPQGPINTEKALAKSAAAISFQFRKVQLIQRRIEFGSRLKHAGNRGD